MPDTDVLVSELTQASAIDTNDLMLMTQPDAESQTGYASRKGTVLQVATKVLKNTEYTTDLPDFTDKTIIGALKELKADTKPVKTANGNPCTFTTDLADNLVSLTAEIVASGGGGTPSTPIPIVGYTEANITRCGANIWNEEWELSGSTVVSKYPIRVTPNTTYFIACSVTADIDNVSKSGQYISYITSKSNGTFTTPADCNFIKFTMRSSYGTTYNNDISINYPATDTTYHPYNGQTYTIAFGQTVYGGVLDVTRGKLHVTHALVDLGTCTWGGGSDVGGKNLFTVAISDIKRPSATTIVPNWLIEGYQIKSQSEAVNYNNVYSGLGWFDGVAFWTTDYTAAQREQLKSDMLGVHLCYELETPFDIDLTPVQISALVGTNNITSDLGGDVNVRYADGQLARDIIDIVRLVINENA